MDRPPWSPMPWAAAREVAGEICGPGEGPGDAVIRGRDRSRRSRRRSGTVPDMPHPSGSGPARRRSPTGRRDHAFLLLAVQTGLRVSELIGLRCADVHLGIGAHVSCRGKGRKERITPLTGGTVAVLRVWLAERGGGPDDPLFPTRTGTPLSRDAIERRLAKYTAIAAVGQPVPRRQAGHGARTAARRRDAPPRGWRRHVGHRPLVGPRAARHYPDLSARRPRPQGTGAREDDTTGLEARALSTIRCDPGLPRGALIRSIRSCRPHRPGAFTQPGPRSSGSA